jgi:hypothetical protein
MFCISQAKNIRVLTNLENLLVRESERSGIVRESQGILK